MSGTHKIRIPRRWHSRQCLQILTCAFPAGLARSRHTRRRFRRIMMMAMASVTVVVTFPAQLMLRLALGQTEPRSAAIVPRIGVDRFLQLRRLQLRQGRVGSTGDARRFGRGGGVKRRRHRKALRWVPFVLVGQQTWDGLARYPVQNELLIVHGGHGGVLRGDEGRWGDRGWCDVFFGFVHRQVGGNFFRGLNSGRGVDFSTCEEPINQSID